MNTPSLQPSSPKWPSDDTKLLQVIICKIDHTYIAKTLNALPIEIVLLEDLESSNSLDFKVGSGILGFGRSNVLGSLSASQEGQSKLASSKKEIAALCTLGSFQTFHLSGDNQNDCCIWIACRAIEIAQTVSIDSTRSRRALAALRREHDETLQNFAELESTYSLVTPKRYVKLEFPASAANVYVGSNRHRGLTQRIPVSPSGIALVELCFGSGPANFEGELALSLFAGGASAPLKTWTMPLRRHPVGWQSFWMDRALRTSGVDARLELSFIGITTDMDLEMQLSVPNSLQEFCAFDSVGTRVSAPLAVRVWGAPPGSLVSCIESGPEEIVSISAEKRTAQPIRFPLSTDDLRRIEIASPTDGQHKHLVGFRADHHDVLVHPHSEFVTIAILRDYKVHALQALSAIVCVDNKDALPVEFGLAAVPSSSFYADPSSLIRKWTRAFPLIYTEVSGEVELANITDETASFDLLFATRMADGSPSNFAWAYFKRVELVA